MPFLLPNLQRQSTEGISSIWYSQCYGTDCSFTGFPVMWPWTPV